MRVGDSRFSASASGLGLMDMDIVHCPVSETAACVETAPVDSRRRSVCGELWVRLTTLSSSDSTAKPPVVEPAPPMGGGDWWRRASKVRTHRWGTPSGGGVRWSAMGRFRFGASKADSESDIFLKDAMP